MTQALHTLLEHAERQRNDAVRLLLQAEEQQRRLQQQGDQLNQYRDEYRQRQPGRGGVSVSIEVLRSHHEFMTRLDQALLQQQHHMQLAERRVAARRTELLALETRVASVRKLMERRSHEQQRRAAHAEQRRSDDDSSRMRRATGRNSPWHSSDVVPLH